MQVVGPHPINSRALILNYIQIWFPFPSFTLTDGHNWKLNLVQTQSSSCHHILAVSNQYHALWRVYNFETHLKSGLTQVAHSHHIPHELQDCLTKYHTDGPQSD